MNLNVWNVKTDQLFYNIYQENVEYQHSFRISISKMYDMFSIWSSLFKPIIHRSVRNAYIMLNCAPFVKYVHSQCQLSSANLTLRPFHFWICIIKPYYIHVHISWNEIMQSMNDSSVVGTSNFALNHNYLFWLK